MIYAGKMASFLLALSLTYELHSKNNTSTLHLNKLLARRPSIADQAAQEVIPWHRPVSNFEHNNLVSRELDLETETGPPHNLADDKLLRNELLIIPPLSLIIRKARGPKPPPRLHILI